MKLLDKINIAFKDLTNRKSRSFLTIIAISIGTLLIVVMMGLGDGIIAQNQKLLKSFGNMNEIYIYPEKVQQQSNIKVQVVNNSNINLQKEDEVKEEENNFKKITDIELEGIEKIQGIEKVRAVIAGNISGIKGEDGDYIDKSYMAIGVSTKYDHDFSEEVEYGTGYIQDKDGIVLGQAIAKKLGFNGDKDIGKEVSLKVEYPELEGVVLKEPLEIKGKLVGIMSKDVSNDTVIIMQSKTLEPLIEYYTWEENYISQNGYTMAYVYGEEGSDIGKISNEISSKFEYRTMSLDFVSNMINTIGGVLKGVLSIAGIIVLVVSALGLINTMTMILQEKKKMIGVMRSVGSSKSNIRLIFIFQSIFLGIVGGIVGSGIGALGIFIINETIAKAQGLSILVKANNIIIAIAITVVISLIAGLIPSSKAANLNVVEAVAEE